MECPKCGVDNWQEAERCRMCGAELRPRSGTSGPSKICPFCNAVNDVNAVFCSRCNKHLGGTSKQALAEEKEKTKKERYTDRTYADYPSSAKATARLGLAGTIMIMAGFLTFLDVAFTLGIGFSITQMDVYDELVEQNPQYKSLIPNLVVCESLRIVFACIMIVGAFSAIRRLNFGLALLGTIFGILALGSSILALVWFPFLLTTGALFIGLLIALGMILLSRREFMLT